MKAKRFKDLSRMGRLWATLLMAVSLALVAAAERDIRRRPADQVRGSKGIWRLVCLDALGAVSYYLWGRRPSAL